MKIISLSFLVCVLTLLSSCTAPKSSSDPLSLWNDTPMKAKIISFIENEVPNIPVEDRLATFDLDGTLACEKPLWFEMYCAVEGLSLQVEKDSLLLNRTIYQYAEKLKANPADTSVTNHYGPQIDTMVDSAFYNWNSEKYIAFCNNYLGEAVNPDYQVTLNKTFYPPMLQLIKYLKANQFEVYVVSGSLQGLLWSVCPGAINFDRKHLIGTRQAMSFTYYEGGKALFTLLPRNYEPKNNDGGKAIDIYTFIGKAPVFAFGNTTGDFGMFKITTSNSLPNASFLLNHNDTIREYGYSPGYSADTIGWRDTMAVYGWNIVDMKENFKAIFEEKEQ